MNKTAKTQGFSWLQECRRCGKLNKYVNCEENGSESNEGDIQM